MIVPMLQHADVWRGIDRLAAKHGLSASGLARRAGLDPTAFNPSKRITREGRPRWPSTESLAKILTITGEPFGDFVLLTVAADADRAGTDTAYPKGAAAFDQPAGHASLRARPVARTIPLITLERLAAPGSISAAGKPDGPGWDHLDFAGSIGRDAFAVTIAGGQFDPVYRDGDTLVASTVAEIRRGDRIVFVTTGATAMIARLVRQDEDGLHLEGIRPAAPSRPMQAQFVPQGELLLVARIIWVSQ